MSSLGILLGKGMSIYDRQLLIALQTFNSIFQQG
jgi:hypothetical protein